MKRISKALCIAVTATFLWNCTGEESKTLLVQSEGVLVNQIGFPPAAAKKGLSKIEAETFELVDSQGKSVYQGDLEKPLYWEAAGDTFQIADFSKFTKPGEYRLCVNDSLCSSPFTIGNSPYKELADATLKSYYYARASVPVEEAYGGVYSRPSGHPDTAVIVHASAADKIRPEGSRISSEGGWYDAGDYGKYIVNSSITTWTILQSWQINSDYHASQYLNIPESKNELPDILDEALVNLRWMMTMQDPSDGGVYHKLTTKNFDGFIMPHETSKPRYVVQKSTAAALDFAATLASASRVYQQQGLDQLSTEMAESAQAAWQWAIRNPETFYNQPEDISTGKYDDSNYQDEWFWAAAELYLLTGEDTYKRSFEQAYLDPVTPKWDVVQTLGIISLITSSEGIAFDDYVSDFIDYVNQMVRKAENSPVLLSMDKFAWGSNSDVANDGMLKLIAYQLTTDQKYVNSAQNDLDYILGRNATGYSFVTGFGSNTPQVPHNRIFSADEITAPIPGYIVGGPNTIVLSDCKPDTVLRSTFPASSYTDSECSYSTNETAINWNAPLVFLISGLINTRKE